jgi:hypothetical protein
MAKVKHFSIEEWDTYYKEVLKRLPEHSKERRDSGLITAILVLSDRIKVPNSNPSN